MDSTLAASLYFERMEALLKASQSLAAIESMDRLMPRLMELAEEVTVAQASSILLYDPTAQELTFWYTRTGEGSPATTEDILKSSIRLRMGEGIAGWVAQHRKALLIEDVQQDPRFCNRADVATGFVTRDVICAPIIYQDELLGVIQVLNALHKPHFDGEDAKVLECFACLAAVSIIRARLLEERLAQRVLETQLQTAAKLQSLFWPSLPTLEHGAALWAHSQPARFVGGDLYDCIELPDGSLILYVADVSGKGLPASLIMAAVWTQLRTQAYLTPHPGELLERVNEPLHTLLAREGYFVTCLVCRFWPATGQVQAAMAGHPAPLWRCGGAWKPFPREADMPLGVSTGVRYPSVSITLSPGDGLLLYTDGLTEAFNEQDERFEDVAMTPALDEIIAGTRDRGPVGEALVARLHAWRGTTSLSDDLTLLEVWRNPLP
ncbi:MAG: SpoIIE family protein phosphatase [Desulfovibrio sp.]|nr:SpoIIE family protein phosphatase [Desulfovibrio sp.]MCA1986670.1 SpoIIE family protein phosphatase [Desulfovibrio sp.]